MSERERLYRFLEERDPMQLDKDGNYYIRHVEAMTAEGLHAKSDIASELGWRDREIDRLKARAQIAEQREAELTDHLHKMAREQTELRHEVKRLTDELSQTKKAVTDAELTWQSTDWWLERYKTWPEDIRRKLSVYDLRRMTGWRPAIEREAKES